ncbi:ATP-binding protein [Streptomyces lanatus]|uniref:BREX system ATP-binding domain-containing protein n=1 Tax=Streptomyces lanatus TaxID=66900 RepID=A0ABV1XJI7_9ACTN|nr:LuxR family transcriptional regulator [Streptomyces lanatus]GHG91420.1 SARP family transcriptional regulator [Streptomyces lanatus]
MPTPGDRRLVGREREQAALRAALDATAAGRGSLLLFHGPSGSGKSLLLRTAGARAALRGMAVSTARLARLDQHSAMAPLLAALSTGPHPVLSAVQAGSLAEFADRPTHWSRLIERLHRLIERRAAHSPLVIVLDDLQWADELTLAALETLLPRLADVPVLWLAAYTDFPVVRPTRDALDRLPAAHAEVVPLSALDGPAAAELAAQLLGTVGPEDIRRVVTATGGIPALIERLVQLLREEGRIRTEDGTVRVLGGHPPADLARAAAPVLSGLAQQTRELLQVGAVLGPRFSLREVSALTGRSTMELATAAQEAAAAGLLEDDGAAFRFRAPLVHQALHDSLLGPVRRALHAEAARLCAAEGRPCPETIGHLILSGTEEDLEQGAAHLEWLKRNEDSVPSHEREELSRALLTQLRRYDPLATGPVRTAVRLFLATGQPGTAHRMLDAALAGAGWETDAEAEAFAELVEVLLRSGQAHDALRHLRRAAEDTRSPARRQAWLTALEARCLAAAGNDPAHAARLARSAVVLARQTADHASAALGTALLAGFAQRAGDIGTASRLAGEAVAGGPYGAERSFGWGLAVPALVLSSAGRPLDAGEVLKAWRNATGEQAWGWAAPRWHLARSVQLWHCGRLADAEQEAQAGLEACGRLDDPGSRKALRAMLTLLATVRGDLERAAARSASPEGPPSGSVGAFPALVGALLLDASGDPEAAVRQLAGLWADPERHTWLLAADPLVLPHLVRIALRAGAHEQAAEAVDLARRLARQSPGITPVTGAALHSQGLYRGLAAPLHRAVRVFRGGSHPLALASALEDAADATRAQGEPLRATEMLQEAQRIYVAAGAGLGAERVRRRTRFSPGRTVGELPAARRAPAVPSARAAEGTADWDSLTPSEVRVVRLVAEGLTNRETAQRLAVSAHTVDSHLRRAFAKLGVSRRVELARHVLAHTSK